MRIVVELLIILRLVLTNIRLWRFDKLTPRADRENWPWKPKLKALRLLHVLYSLAKIHPLNYSTLIIFAITVKFVLSRLWAAFFWRENRAINHCVWNTLWIIDFILVAMFQKEKTEEVTSKRMDFLDILLCAKDEAGNGLTDLEIRNEVDTFLFEGSLWRLSVTSVLVTCWLVAKHQTGVILMLLYYSLITMRCVVLLTLPLLRCLLE